MRIKRFLSGLLAVSLAACLAAPLPAAAAGSSFSDISDSATAVNADILRLMGVVDGTGDNLFNPGGSLTRAEFCTMVVKFMQKGDEVPIYATRTIFSDVTSSHWGLGYINLAASLNVGTEEAPVSLISGVGDGRFEPESKITLAQAVTILVRVLGYSSEQTGAVWPQSYLNLADSIGLTDGVTAGVYDEITRAQAANIHSRLLWFSRTAEPGEGAFLRDGRIVFTMDGKTEEICPAADVRIPGAHNLENALAAVCLAKAMGISGEAIAKTLRTFPGVEHRIEFVREVNGVRYINDSKGTNPDATIKAIEAMTAPTVLILGGYDKHSEFDEMFAAFTPQITDVVLLGATRDKLEAAAKKAGFRKVILAEDFADAVKKASAAAKCGGNVLLSPACASWDMFDNFEQRGDVFKELVAEL